jgi:hypothetical protein
MEKAILDSMNGLLRRMHRLQGYAQAVDRARDEIMARAKNGQINKEDVAAVLLDLERRALQRMLAIAAKGVELRRQLNFVKAETETTVIH